MHRKFSAQIPKTIEMDLSNDESVFFSNQTSLNSSTHFGVLEIDLDSRSWKNEPSILADGGPRYRSVELGAIFEPFESVQIGAIFQFE